MPQEKVYTITFTASVWGMIMENIQNTMTVKNGLPILNEIDRQAKEQDEKEKNKDEIAKLAEKVAPEKK